MSRHDVLLSGTWFLGQLGPTELLLVFGAVVLLFGAKKLPELARGSGRALRIFRDETRGLVDETEREYEAAARLHEQ